MGPYVAGLVLLLGVHALPMAPATRTRVVTAWGERRYKLAYSVVSLAGLALIVLGWRAAGPGAQLFAPSPTAIRIAPYAMIVVFILLASSHAPAHIRASVKHPMLIAVILWAVVHLAANGDTRGTILFGALLAYAVVDLASAVRRHAVAVFEPRWTADIVAVVAGTIVALLVMALHRLLFGPAVASFSL